MAPAPSIRRGPRGGGDREAPTAEEGKTEEARGEDEMNGPDFFFVLSFLFFFLLMKDVKRSFMKDFRRYFVIYWI